MSCSLLIIFSLCRQDQVSALQAMPSAVGYQPTLATEIGLLQERITSTKLVQSPLCRPCIPNDFTDRQQPLHLLIWMRLRFCLEALLGRIYPAIDPLNSSSRILEANIVGPEHYRVSHAVRSILQRYKDLQDIAYFRY